MIEVYRAVVSGGGLLRRDTSFLIPNVLKLVVTFLSNFKVCFIHRGVRIQSKLKPATSSEEKENESKEVPSGVFHLMTTSRNDLAKIQFE